MADRQGGQTVVVSMLVDDDIMRACSGSEHFGFNSKLLGDVMRCSSSASLTDAGQDHENAGKMLAGATMAAMKAFEPADPIEGMLAAQAVALHSASMECLRRALLPHQPAEISSKLRKDGANLARAMTDMLAAMDRKRGKGQQHIRVERVMVAEGGQAIVGKVTAGRSPAPVTTAIEQQTAVPMEIMTEPGKVGG